MRSADYWKKRAEARMDRGMVEADAVLDQLERAYAKASRELQGDIRRLYEKYGDEYGLSYVDAIKYIDASDFKEWRYTLEEYVERIRETGDAELLKELDTLATRARVTRLQTLETAIKVNTAELGQKGETLVTQLIGDTYENTYYRSAYDFQRGIGVGSSLEMLSPDQVAKAISYPWSGADYSSRIWKNAAALEASLRETITQGLIQGKDIRQMTAAIQDATGAGVYNAQRLVRTETAYMVEAAELRSYADSGVDEYEILVAADERLCKKCGARSGDVHKVSDARVAVNYPPFHSNCRCTTMAHFSEEQMGEWEKLGAEAEQLSFAEWKDKYVRDGSPDGKVDKYHELQYTGSGATGAISQEQIEKVNHAYKRVVSDFPAVEETLTGIKVVSTDDISPAEMHVQVDPVFKQILQINENAFNSGNINKIASDGTHAVATEQGIVAHELGHAILHTAALKKLGYTPGTPMTAIQRGLFSTIESQVVQGGYIVAFTNETFEEIKNRVRFEISERAAEGSGEFIAECVSQCYFGTHVSSIARDVVNYLKALM